MNKKQPSPISCLCLDLGVLGCRIILITEVEWDRRFQQEIMYISKLFVSKSYLLGVQLNNIIFSQKAYTITWIVLSINYIIICWPLQHNASEESWTHTGLVGFLFITNQLLPPVLRIKNSGLDFISCLYQCQFMN